MFHCTILVLLVAYSAIAQETDSTLTYNQRRDKLTQIVDGMTLQFRILRSSYVSCESCRFVTVLHVYIAAIQT